MKEVKARVPEADIRGAMNDLNDLKAAGKYTKEIKAIQKEFF
jgi:hypothetical protein